MGGDGGSMATVLMPARMASKGRRHVAYQKTGGYGGGGASGVSRPGGGLSCGGGGEGGVGGAGYTETACQS